MAIQHARMSDVVHGGKNEKQPRKKNCESARAGEGSSEPKSREHAQKRCHEDVWNGKRLNAAEGSDQVTVTSTGEGDSAKSRPDENRRMIKHIDNRQLLLHSNVRSITIQI